MKIRIWVEGVPAAATLEGNATAVEFASMLPLNLTLEDYASTEKIANLPRRLSAHQGPRDGAAGFAGEIAYFPPWGNLAVFYRDFRYSHGLVRLGKIEGDIGALSRPGTVTVRIERMENE